MSKIIIHNKTDISDIKVLYYVQKVIEAGRDSNNGKQYCHITWITIENKDYCILTQLRKCSDVFTFYKQ